METPSETPGTAFIDGGGGALSAGESKRTADLVRRAIKERWPIPEHLRERLPEILASIAEKSTDDRARVAAGKTLLEADKLNQEQERRDQRIPDRVDVTSGGKPIAAAIPVDLKALSDEQLRREIEELESRGGSASAGGGAES
jgi:hypothetical protein